MGIYSNPAIAAISAVQEAKTSFINTFIKEESVKKPLQAYVDAQSTFAKEVAKQVEFFGHSIWDASLAACDDAFAFVNKKTK